MPNSSSSCPSEQEANQSSNSSAAAPLSPQTRAAEREVDPNAMLLVAMMASGTERTRLVTSRSRDDGQSDTEHKNDIISQSNHTTTSNGAVGKKSVNVVLLPPSNPPGQFNSVLRSTEADESAQGDSCSVSQDTLQPSTESSRSTSRTNQQNPHQLSADFVQASIHAALASVRGKQSESIETSDSEKETGDEESASKMQLNQNVVSKKPRRKRTPQAKAGQTSGRWTQQEHQAFLEGLRECGREWKKVAMRIPTRTSAQIRSHAQKYFSKIQRDHENLFLPESAGAGCTTATVSSTDNQSLAPSVQRNVERILANPVAVQQEVENTLEALRARYRQLQLRLEQRQRQRTSRHDLSRDTNYRHCVPNDEPDTSNVLPSKRRTLVDTEVRPRLASSSSNSHDDQSSVSSNVSASVASMGHDELIALHVLQGSLPRGESSHDLERMVVRSMNSSDVYVDSLSGAAPGYQDQQMPQADENENHSDCSHGMHDEEPIAKRPKSN